MNQEKVLPIWQKTIQDLIKTERILNISGFTHDIYLSFDRSGYSTFAEYLQDLLKSEGYNEYLFFNPCTGFGDNPANFKTAPYSRGGSFGKTRCISILADRVEKELSDTEQKKAIVVLDASFLCTSNAHLTNEEHDAWVKIRSVLSNCSPKNRLIMVFESDSDIPRALDPCSGLSKGLIVSRPDQTQRKQFLAFTLPHLNDEEQEYIADISSDLGLKKLTDILAELHQINTRPDKLMISKAIKKYIYGYSDNPWQRLSKEKIFQLDSNLKKHIKGQSEAIEMMVEKIKAACTGTVNILEGYSAPKGIACLAGPTGVGKTELAKQVTKLVMGDQDLLIRIDANEYAEEHQTQRLIGSPPGYVGYEQGGQLTNAVNERPFSFVLIDEIEKAHPRFWDFLLQVLQDGRLTDGRGNLCMFSNAFLVFTTNLGAREASTCEDPSEARNTIYNAIEQYFVSINRTEIFGRLRPHIIPFNNVTDSVASEIVEKHLKTICENYLSEQRVEVQFSEAVIEKLKLAAGKASKYGGRDIKNEVNQIIFDQLTEIHLDNDIQEGSVIHISDIALSEREKEPVKFIYTVDNSFVKKDANIYPFKQEHFGRRPVASDNKDVETKRIITVKRRG